LLVAVRDGYPSVFRDAGLPELRLAGLDDAAAEALLDVSAARLPLALRSRVLRVAAGNPLALLELPALVGKADDAPGAPGGVPLSDRLERAFAARVSDLPVATRLVLLVAALNDSEAMGEILSAGSAVVGADLRVDVVGAAVEAGIVDVDLQTLRFRHPLIRSAVAQGAALGERRRVHEAWRLSRPSNPTAGPGTGRHCSPARTRTSPSSSTRPGSARGGAGRSPWRSLR
jgi:hypothetical protein